MRVSAPRLIGLGTWLSLCPAPAAAQGEADWTAILLMSATYDSMREKLSWSGASPAVNVVVLHDQDGYGLVAYRMLPDTNPEHAPGDCCPGEIQPCCDSEEIPLAEIGLSEGLAVYDPGVLSTFFTFVAQRFPARHYLVSARGQAWGAEILMRNEGGGMPIVDFVTELETLRDLAGHPVDVVNLGFCLSGNVDFAYALRTVADWYVGTANLSNPPVAARWRFYRWVRALIVDPSTTPAALAGLLPDVYAETTPDCIDAGDYCCNTNPPNPNAWYPEPWTASTVELGQMDALAAATETLVDALLVDFRDHEADFASAAQAAAVYAYPDNETIDRLDLAYFADQLAARSADPAVDAAAAAVAAAVDAAVTNNRFQTGGWFDGGDHARGLSIYGEEGGLYESYEVERYGTWAHDSGWLRLLEADEGDESATVTSFSLRPDPVTATVGSTVTIWADVVTLEYGPITDAPVFWDATSLYGVGELTGYGNPTQFVGRFPGTGMLRATYGNAYAEVEVRVRRSTDATPDPTGIPWLDGEADGCACAGAPGRGGLVALLLAVGSGLAALGRRARR